MQKARFIRKRLREKPLYDILSTMRLDAVNNVLITGCSSGIGAAFTNYWLERGSRVWGVARKFTGVSNNEHFSPLQLDLLEPHDLDSIKKLFLTVPFDLVINNAGFGVFEKFEEMKEEDLTQQWLVMGLAPIKISRWAYLSMKKMGQGIIVNISSLASIYPLPYMSGYNAVKAALMAYTRTMDLENDCPSIKIIDAQLGDICTSFDKKIKRNFSNNEEMNQKKVLDVMSYRMGKSPSPEWVARKLHSILKKGCHGTVVIAPTTQKCLHALSSFADWPLIRKFLRFYYKM